MKANKDGWMPCSRELPDSDLTVMIFQAEGDEPVWLGFHDGEVWRRVDGVRCKGKAISHWRELPAGPDGGRR